MKQITLDQAKSLLSKYHYGLHVATGILCPIELNEDPANDNFLSVRAQDDYTGIEVDFYAADNQVVKVEGTTITLIGIDTEDNPDASATTRVGFQLFEFVDLERQFTPLE